MFLNKDDVAKIAKKIAREQIEDSLSWGELSRELRKIGESISEAKNFPKIYVYPGGVISSYKVERDFRSSAGAIYFGGVYKEPPVKEMSVVDFLNLLVSSMGVEIVAEPEKAAEVSIKKKARAKSQMTYTISEVWEKDGKPESLFYSSDYPDTYSIESKQFERAGYELVFRKVEKLGGER